MEIKAQLTKPYTEEQRIEFIVEQNHRNGYEIREDQDFLTAWGYTQEELEEKKKALAQNSFLTRGDVFRGLLQACGITRKQLRGILENLQEDTETQKISKELALIDFDEAINFYRKNPLIDKLGEELGIYTDSLDMFFMTNDYKTLKDSQFYEKSTGEMPQCNLSLNNE